MKKNVIHLAHYLCLSFLLMVSWGVSAQPSNDDCADAIALTVNTEIGCSSITAGTIDEATASGVDEAACSGTEDDDVWFSFVATEEEHAIALLNTMNGTSDLYHSVWEGSCDDLSLVAGSCSDPNTSVVDGLTPGNTYYLRVYSWTSTAGQTTDFDVCVGVLPSGIPSNDECADAVALTVNPDEECGSVTTGTIFGATASGVDEAACGGTEDDDVWFSFVATAAFHSIDLLNITGGTTDLYHSVWEGSCDDLTLVEGSCSDPNSSTVMGLTPGNTYYLRVYSWTSTAGQSSVFDVCIGTTPVTMLTSADSPFTDSGGAGGDYGNNEFAIYTICPDAPEDVLQVTFTSFSTENLGTTGCFDDLTVFDGDAAFVDPIIPAPGGDSWCWDLNDDPPVGTGDLTGIPLTSTDDSGCLTFVFDSDGSATRPGWTADILSAAPATCEITGCPGADLVVEADPGDCSAAVTYNVGIVGDCLQPGTTVEVIGGADATGNTNGDFVGGTAGWTVGSAVFGSPYCEAALCGTGAGTINYGTAPNSGAGLLWFGGAGFFGPEAAFAETTVEIPNLGASQTATLSFAFENSFCGSADDFTRVLIDGNEEWVHFADPDDCGTAGDVMLIELDVTAYADGNDHTIRFEGEQTTTTTTNFTVDNVTLEVSTPPTGNGELVANPDNLPAGSQFPIGSTPISFEVVDISGDVIDECNFNVVVGEFANPTSTLACNDGVQVSLDEDCEAVIGADMILEGGPYGCYDDYIVMVLGPLNQNLGNVVNYNFVGDEYVVKVTDPDSGQSCWGSIVVEDKLDPVINCEPITVDCTTDLTPSAVAGTASVSDSPGTVISDNSTFDEVISIAGVPGGNIVKDVNITLDISHTFSSDLEIFLTAPNGTTVELATDVCGGTNDWGNVTFDDEATAVLPGACNGTAPALSGSVQPEGSLSAFDGCPVNGEWILTVGDDAGGDQGSLNSYTIEVTYGQTVVDNVDASDNCVIASIDYSDAFVDGACGGPSGTVVRTWVVEDGAGHTATCNQVITIARPTLDDVQVPADIQWSCVQYAAWPNIIEPIHRNKFLRDCDAATDIFEVTCYDHTCNDDVLLDPEYCDNPSIDNTDQNGCTVSGLPCTSPFNVPNPGLENEDVFSITGSGVPTVGGNPLEEICEISVDVDDITVDVCEGTFKIVRKWTLIDWCADPVDVREINQVVKVVDETAPSLSLKSEFLPNSFNQPEVINVYDASAPGSAPHQICEGSVVAPPAVNMGDDCSGIGSRTTEIWTVDNAGNPVSLIGSVPSNGGIFFEIPLFENGVPARYVLRYYAEDGCGNQAFTDLYIRVNDRVPPVAVCDEITEVSITNNGLNTGESCSTLHAEDLDDGSYDNCSPVFFLIADMVGTNPALWQFRPSIDYCCEDLGENMAVVAVVANNGSTSAVVENFLNTIGYVPGGTLVNPSSNASTFAGQVNTCMVQVEVTDKLPPVLISCPSNVRILCDDYAATLETQLANAADDEEACDIITAAGYGEAEFLDNCSLNVSCNFTNAVDQCLEGFLRRRWTATDDAGNNSLQTCTQRIFVDHVSDWAVEFPADITVECGDDVPDFGEPEIFFETCELVAVNHDDEFFYTVPDACYKILRTWQVINWCVVGDDIDDEVVELSEAELWNAGITNLSDRDINNDGFFSPNVNTQSGRTFRDSWYDNGDGISNVLDKPNASIATQNTNPDTDLDSDPWDGFITYQQTIKVIDDVDPVFTNGCEIPQVCIEDNTCGATVLLPTPEIGECSDDVNLSVTINIGGATLSGFGPYLNVSPGVYDVRYVAMDNCNNQSACETTVTVADCKKPTPYCKNGIIVEIMQTGMIEVWASDLNDNSFDNCPGALKFSFSSNVDDIGVTYTCDDLGQQPVELWVTDAAGNQDFCETFIVVQDNMNHCPGDDPIVAGITATEDDLGVEGVSININSTTGFNSDLTTDGNGSFNTAVAAGGDYTVTPVYDEDPLNGVSTFDLVLISKHILGVQPLDSPYKIIAADANKSNSLTTFDMVTIRRLILFIDTEFANNTSWRFFDANCDFANTTDPFSAMCDEVVSINDIPVGMNAADFVAVKVGDVNSSAATNLLGSAEDRTMVGDLVFDVEDMEVQKGERYTVDFKATDFNVSGYQFTLNFDQSALDFVEVGAGLADASNFGLSMVEEGVLTASWNSNAAKQVSTGQTVFSLTFDANQNGQLSDLLGLNSRYTVAEAYNADAQLLNVALSFNSDVVANGFELFQNTPNPFASTTTIGFYLPEATSATLTISDVQGKVVKVINGDFAEGFNNVNLKRGELNANGVLYYRLDAGADTATRKMILVD